VQRSLVREQRRQGSRNLAKTLLLGLRFDKGAVLLLVVVVRSPSLKLKGKSVPIEVLAFDLSSGSSVLGRKKELAQKEVKSMILLGDSQVMFGLLRDCST
jgi:hypothetical protein